MWNLYPGGHDLQVAFPDDRKSVSLYVIVYPGLTSKVKLENNNDVYSLVDDGFADQSGHILTYDRNDASLLPGELNDGIGQMAKTFSDSAGYSYDNLVMKHNAGDRSFNPSGKSQFDYVMVNRSNPFAGYDDGEISLISNFQGPDNIGFEGVYGTRNQRYYRINAARALPRNIGVFFGSLNFENHDDAAPRANVDDKLRHNSAENVEILAGASLNLNARFKSDFRFVYKRNHRNYYLHRYYFDYEHSPREEQDFYNGRVSVNGWLSDNLFADLFYRFDGYESRIGDGVYFDDLESYYRIDIYDFDETGLFYSWDDLSGATPYIDESHVYNRYTRTKTSGNQIGLKGRYHLNNNIQLLADMSYKFDQYRKYDRLNPTVSSPYWTSNIGFDSLGDKTTDGEGYTTVPKPKLFNISLGGKYLSEKVTVQGAVDFVSFDPGSRTLASERYPYDLLAGELLLADAETREKIGYRLSIEINDLMYSDNGRLGFFFNTARRFEIPDYSRLYTDYNFFEETILLGPLYYHPSGNPNLKLIEHQNYEFGLIYRYRHHSLAFSYNYQRLLNDIMLQRIPSIPGSYSLYYSNTEFKDTKSVSLSYMNNKKSFFNLSFYAGYYWFDPLFSEIEMLLSLEPYYENMDDFFRLNGTVILRPEKLIENDDGFINKALARTEFSAVGNFLFDHGVKPAYGFNKIYDYGSFIDPNSINKNIIEVNVGMTATILDSDEASLKIAFEVLNLFDRGNQIAYDTTTYFPIGYLDTDAGQDWLDYFEDPDSSGMNGYEKVMLFVDNPNNYGRPRVFRVSARLEF